MQYQPYKASNNATIQCSTCHKSIDIGLIAEHTCVKSAPLPQKTPLPYPTSIPEIRTPPSPAGSFQAPPPRAGTNLKPQRPVLPKIDASLACEQRLPVDAAVIANIVTGQHSELTPASSGNGSLLASPVSATSSRTSRSRSRESSALQRPPSPELISQDCAFPPFPGMSTAKSKSSSKDRTGQSRKEQHRSRVPASATSSARSSSSSPLSHSRTTSSTSTGTTATTTTRGRARSIFGEGRPTTAPEGHAPEFSSQLRNITMPPPAVPSVPPPLTRAETTPNPLPTLAPEPSPLFKPTIDNGIRSSVRGHSATDAERSVFGSAAEREPNYKSKRPPPIASNLAPPFNSQPAKSPPPSGKSLKRTLTEKLFGRRPSNGRRSMVRAALSDEPEQMPVPPMPPPPLSASAIPATAPPRPARSPEPQSPRLINPEPSTLHPSPVITVTNNELEPEALPPQLKDVERERDASFAALEGGGSHSEKVPEPKDDYNHQSSPQVSAEPSSAGFDFGLGQPNNDLPLAPAKEVAFSTEASNGNDVNAMKRLSIDSASSYGSIGFTERTFSSRSTPPPTDEVTRKKSDNPHQLAVEGSQLNMPAPLRPREIDPMAGSPSDLHSVNSHLSPLWLRGKDTDVVKPIHAKVVPPPGADAEKDRTSSVFSSSDDDEIDLKPTAGFRPRKDSLAGAPPPLFHKSRAGSQSSHADIEVPPIPADRPQHRPRQDSLASVGGRNGIKGTCRGCLQPILATEKSVSSADGRLSGKYHKQCFACHTCKEPFATAEFYVHADRPYCAHHYHQLEDSLCATCGKGIEGLYMETANVAGRGKEKHHPTCLKCATCRVQLTNDYFELSGKVYCERDAFRIASPRVHSKGPTRPSPLVREYIRSGDPGALRGTNFPERRIGRPMLEVR